MPVVCGKDVSFWSVIMQGDANKKNPKNSAWNSFNSFAKSALWF